MSSVHLDQVSFSYSSATPVLEDVSLHLGPGWAGVVGANGSGKSTLLALVAGALAPSAGSLRIEPAWCRPILCPQVVEEPGAAITAFAASTDGDARRWLGRLELDPGGCERWPTLSPGERKRWQVAAALAAEPGVLLLDEPTNHLDTQGREILLNALARFPGVGLVVSHDRALLDQLTVRTIHIEHAAAMLWNGPYEVARESWRAQAREHQAAWQRASREHKKLRRRLADQRRAVEARQARHKRSLRTAAAGDTDARSMAAKGRHQLGAAVASRRMEVTRSALDRAGDTLRSFTMRRELGRSLFFDYEPARRARLLSYAGELRAGGRLLAPRVAVEVGRDDRIRVAGRNGAGKSTLLVALVGASTLPDQRLLFLPQELRQHDVADAMARLAALPPEPRGRVLTLVAALGVDPDRLLLSARPSPGEARKLVMAFGLALSAWCLVLDEPTNHLDLPSIEHLENAIADYPGAVVMVTHDEQLAAATTSTTWQIVRREGHAVVSRE